MLESRGIQVVDSTLFLKPLLPEAGPLTRRAPDAEEQSDIAYGREIAKKLAGLDIGQTIVVSGRACVAVEAMEGTDAAIERAASLSNGRRLVVVKVSKPRQDMRFDVPVVGLKTIQVMRRSNARVLAVDAGKTLLFERSGHDQGSGRGGHRHRGNERLRRRKSKFENGNWKFETEVETSSFGSSIQFQFDFPIFEFRFSSFQFREGRVERKSCRSRARGR